MHKQIAHTTNLSVVRSKRLIDGRRSDVAMALNVTAETASTKERKFMLARKTVDRNYLNALSSFVDRVQKDVAKTMEAQNDKSVISVTASVEAGRKYDRIIIATLRRHPTKQDEFKTETEVRYFVERSSHRIFGAKSPLAPNENRYFGRVENSKKWDWSGEGGINVSDESVAERGGYGGIKHYADVVETQEVAATA